jgi:cytoskeletal protein CcmA (bactofilin family)
MWRKEGNKSGSGEQHAAVSAQEPANELAAVSQGIKIKGEVSGEGDFYIEGELEGNLRLSSGTFTVGPSARVNAEIEARMVIIRGEVIGTLKGCERVHIFSTGKLTGNIETRGIVIEDGAILHSRVAVPPADGQKAKAAAAGTSADNPSA